MPLAYSYTRFSTPEQLKGDSLRRQTDAAQAYAKEHSLELVTSYRDLGRSAFKGHNRKHALGQFLALVEAGDIPAGSWLLVESFDRLSREQVTKALGLFTSLIGAGITIVTLADGYRYSQDSVDGNWTQLIVSLSIMARAREESETKSARLKASWTTKRDKASRREAITSVAPQWLRLVNGKWEVIPERGVIVERIFRECIGGIGRSTIAKRLNADGIPPFTRAGAPGSGWHQSSVSRVVNTRAAIGEYQPHRMDGEPSNRKRVPSGEPIPNYFPAVVDPATYAKAQAAMASRVRGGGRVGQNVRNLFKGVAVCATCGGPMTFWWKGQRMEDKASYLACSNAARGHRCTNKKHIRYQTLEDTFLKWVCEVDLTPAKTADHTALEVALATKTEERVRLKAKVTRAAELVIEGEEFRDIYHQRKAELTALEAELKALRTRLDQEGHKDAPETRQAQLRGLSARMADAEPADLYAIRSGLAAAIRDVCDGIGCQPSGYAYVTILGATKVYGFKDGRVIAEVNVADVVKGEPELKAKWVGADPKRLALLERLAG